MILVRFDGDALMNTTQDPLREIYRQFQNSHTTEANAVEWFYTQITQMKQIVESQQKQIEELKKNKIPVTEIPKSQERKKQK